MGGTRESVVQVARRAARPGLLAFLVLGLPACSHFPDQASFSALVTFPDMPRAAASACGAAASAEAADPMQPCQADAAMPDGPMQGLAIAGLAASAEDGAAGRADVEAALGAKYHAIANMPAPPMRPGLAATAPSGPATASAPLITGSIAPAAISDPRGPAIEHRRTMALADAVAYAVMTYPEIRAYEARIREARAGVDVSRSAMLPNADLRVATGENFSGSYEGKGVPYTYASNAQDRRFDVGLVLRQLVWDFGATGADIARAGHQRDAEAFKLREKIDEIAWKTAQTYVKILENRALLTLVNETIASHRDLLRIVMAQEKEGQGTSADVNRVRSRLTDISSIRADISLQLKGAEDQFERLTRHRPQRLGGVPNYRARIPASPGAAIIDVLARNPRLAAMQASNLAIEKELEMQTASRLPKFQFELDNETKNFRNAQSGRMQVEARGMLAMRFKLFDGGLHAAQMRQMKARIEGGEMLLLNEREQFEADIRQGYRAIESAGRKGALLAEGVTSSRRVRELYLEQFKAGKRTIFELLDGQMAFYTARRSQIESQFEVPKAVIDILRVSGSLTEVLANGPSAPAEGAKRVAARNKRL